MTTWLGQADAPADEAFAITPNDSTTFEATRGLYVGTGGNIAVTMAGPNVGTVTFEGVPNGSLLPIRVTAVLSTGTSGVSGVVGLR